MLALQQLGRGLRLTVRMPHCRYSSGTDVQVQKIAAVVVSTDTSCQIAGQWHENWNSRTECLFTAAGRGR